MINTRILRDRFLEVSGVWSKEHKEHNGAPFPSRRQKLTGLCYNIHSQITYRTMSKSVYSLTYFYATTFYMPPTAPGNKVIIPNIKQQNQTSKPASIIDCKGLPLTESHFRDSEVSGIYSFRSPTGELEGSYKQKQVAAPSLPASQSPAIWPRSALSYKAFSTQSHQGCWPAMHLENPHFPHT